MNKIFKFMLVFAASAFLFAACDKPEPEPTPTPDPTEVCDECGKNPCECETPEPTPEPTTPDWCDYYFTADYTCEETSDYVIGTLDITTLSDEEGNTVLSALGYETVDELTEALGGIAYHGAYEGDVKIFSYDTGSETDLIDAFNTNGIGHWMTGNGALSSWGAEECRCYYEDGDNWGDDELLYFDGDFTIGIMPGNLKGNDKYSFGIVFQKTECAEVVRVGIQVNISVNVFVDPEAGQYSGTAAVGTFDFDYEATMTLSTHEYDYDGPAFDDFTAIQEKLGMTKYELSQAFAEGYVADDEGALYTGMMVEVVLPDGTAYEGTNVWLNAENAATEWGAEDAAVCFDLYIGATYFEAGACAMPLYYEVPEGEEAPDPYWFYGDGVKAAVGKTIKNTYRITYVPADDLGVATADPTIININLAVTVAE